MKGIRRKKCNLSADLVRELFLYDPLTGKITRRIKRGFRWLEGEEVGSVSESGYRYVSVNSVLYLAHRIIWLYIHGYIPDCDIDHKNRNRDDNRLENLREASRGQNNINSGLQKNNTSGFKGAYYDKRRNCWYAEIWVENKKKFLGRFSTASDAGAAYVAAAKLYFGEFAKDNMQ